MQKKGGGGNHCAWHDLSVVYNKMPMLDTYCSKCYFHEKLKRGIKEKQITAK